MADVKGEPTKTPQSAPSQAEAIGSEADRGLERRLVVLMAARLALSLVSLGVTLTLESAGEHFTTAEWRGFYTTVAIAFLATILYGLVLQRVVKPQRFAALNVVTDVAIVTALVHFSGGPDSVFPFLYLVVVGYGAFFFTDRGSAGTAGLAIASYGAVLFGGHWGWIPNFAIGPPEPFSLLLTSWLVNGSAIVVVAILANRLTSELRRTGEALDRKTSDLLTLQNLHQSTVKSLMSGLLTTNCDGLVTSFNPEAERITGWEACDVVGRDADVVIPGLRENVLCHAGSSDAHTSRLRMAYTNRAGEKLHVGLAGYILKSPEDRAAGHVVIFQDVTWIVEMEHDLRRSERLAAVGELSASIAHEVRNPLAAISGSIQILKNRKAGEGSRDEEQRLMDIVIRETDRLNRLITDFLLYARPGPLKLESVAIGEVADEVVEMFEAVRPENVEAQVEIDPRLHVTADASQLRQIVWNLVLNASDSMKDGGSFRVTATAGEATPQEPGDADRNAAEGPKGSDCVEISVEDRGEGIHPEVLERIFDPFFTTKANGSGLGLAAVHRIMEDHGGSVRIASRVGSGTTVRLSFPQGEVLE